MRREGVRREGVRSEGVRECGSEGVKDEEESIKWAQTQQMESLLDWQDTHRCIYLRHFNQLACHHHNLHEIVVLSYTHMFILLYCHTSMLWYQSILQKSLTVCGRGPWAAM